MKRSSSVTRQRHSSSVGSTSQIALNWSSFVQLVLDITIEAYTDMKNANVVNKNWDEDTFTYNLAIDYIQPVIRRRSSFLFVFTQAKIITPDVKAGITKTVEASQIDIKFGQSWEIYEEIYFAWECKRVSVKGINILYDNLIPSYVTEGIFRFINEEYSKGLNDAGMIGYVLGGLVQDIVIGINNSMISPQRKTKLAATDFLQNASAVNGFSNIYKSQHTHALTTGQIVLHHLFFDF